MSDDGELHALIAEILANYYTCLETMFLRSSRYFENELSAERCDSLDAQVGGCHLLEQ